MPNYPLRILLGVVIFMIIGFFGTVIAILWKQSQSNRKSTNIPKATKLTDLLNTIERDNAVSVDEQWRNEEQLLSSDDDEEEEDNRPLQTQLEGVFEKRLKECSKSQIRFLEEKKTLQNEIFALNEELTQIRTTLNTKILQLEDTLARKENVILLLQEENTKYDEDLLKAQGDVRKLEYQLETQKNKATECKNELNRIIDQPSKNELETQIQTLQEDIQQSKNDLKTMIQQRDQYAQQLQKLIAEKKILQENVDKHIKDDENLQLKLNTANQTINTLRQNQSSVELQVSQLEQNIIELKMENATLKDKMKQRPTTKKLRTQVQGYKDTNKGLVDKIQQLRDENTALIQQINEKPKKQLKLPSNPLTGKKRKKPGDDDIIE